MRGEIQVLFRAIEAKDVGLICRWANDDRVNAGATFRVFPWSERMVRKMIDDGNFESDEKRYLIIETAEGIAIGIAIVRAINRQDRNAELGIVIGEIEYWNKGYGWAVAQKLLELCFNGLGLKRIYVYVPEFNRASGIMAAQLGLAKEGVLRKCFYRDAKFWDATLYSLLDDEWQSQRTLGKR
ncbi:MAG: GNAT family N-acetyltransferase [Firmicutes bacterium]|nr:GNAT family N-acetyltransferase [Dethiobacter sp.]MBS3888092.1 GNAT family N-acetyltransferase [Bacillota bacterium]MBS4054535.1 GNAT family N-acetyltransferase [Thermaerobacter sp.]